MRLRCAILVGVAFGCFGLSAPVTAGLREDLLEAFRRGGDTAVVQLLNTLADRGNSEAQTELGIRSAQGTGAPQDYARAWTLLGKAADQGDPKAQSFIAAMYMNGWGAPKDDSKAAEWYRKAAGSGDTIAPAVLSAWYKQGRLGQRDMAKALMWQEVLVFNVKNDTSTKEDMNDGVNKAFLSAKSNSSAEDVQEGHRLYLEYISKHSRHTRTP